MFWAVDMLALPMLTRHTFEKGDSCVEKAFFVQASRNSIGLSHHVREKREGQERQAKKKKQNHASESPSSCK